MTLVGTYIIIKVRAALLKYPSYPKWNAFMRSITKNTNRHNANLNLGGQNKLDLSLKRTRNTTLLPVGPENNDNDVNLEKQDATQLDNWWYSLFKICRTRRPLFKNSEDFTGILELSSCMESLPRPKDH
ncbi:hypothetical protein Cantr_07550 [Candida viswanathii]|uniref:Uncharacterized protein n=1 Tax=Candida viswanathii TaxID=5486 RepID=A0A367Y0J5_9ASCO|nr:hypothetical protein Cantr_07550 [Candida viswanathii]